MRTGLIVLSIAVLAAVAFFMLQDLPDEPLNSQEDPMNKKTLTLTSPAFENGGLIPSRYTCDGENVNPPLSISGVPEDVKSLVLVMDDPDIPDSVKESRGIEKFDHWVLYNITPDTTDILEAADEYASTGFNSRGEAAYTGPCPPDREHRYIFRLYALPGHLEFVNTPTLDEVETAAKESAIDSAELMGRYERHTDSE